MTIRAAEIGDANRIRELYLSAFDDGEKELVADLAIGLLDETSSPETLQLVAEVDRDLVVGHIAFSPVKSKNCGILIGYILSPLAVDPESQKKGIGSGLVREGMEQLSSQGVDRFFVYGDPEYYSRFNFVSELAKRYIPPYALEYPSGWLAVDLSESEATSKAEEIECVSALGKRELW